MNFTFDENIFSDLHKDARGYRPRGHEFYADETTDQRKQELWDSMCEELEQAMLEESRQELDAQRRFELLVAETIDAGAGDRTTAIRWILDAEGFDAHDAAYGGSSVCYHFGLWYGLKDQFEEACAAIIARDGHPYEEAA